MKKTYKYAVVGLLFLFLAGCEDFLDKREDSGGLTEEAVYSSCLLYTSPSPRD